MEKNGCQITKFNLDLVQFSFTNITMHMTHKMSRYENGCYSMDVQ